MYGSTTAWYTAAFQNSLFSTNNGGVMTPGWLSYFQNATSVYGPRLINTNYTDGYGTSHYSYYGGFDSPVELGWNPFASQWMFSQTPASNPAHSLQQRQAVPSGRSELARRSSSGRAERLPFCAAGATYRTEMPPSVPPSAVEPTTLKSSLGLPLQTRTSV